MKYFIFTWQWKHWIISKDIRVKQVPVNSWTLCGAESLPTAQRCATSTYGREFITLKNRTSICAPSALQLPWDARDSSTVLLAEGVSWRWWTNTFCSFPGQTLSPAPWWGYLKVLPTADDYEVHHQLRLHPPAPLLVVSSSWCFISYTSLHCQTLEQKWH